MDRGPYRPATAQQAARTAASRPAQAQHREEPKAAAPSTAAVHHAAREKKAKKTPLLPYVMGGILVLLAVAWFVWSTMQKNVITGLDSSKHQAVFLANGQVYFGKLQRSGDYLRLTDVFYLQTQNSTDATKEDAKDPQAATSDASAQLIKLGDEVHGPEDEMIISRDQVLFFENLKPDGKVVKLIAQYKSNKN